MTYLVPFDGSATAGTIAQHLRRCARSVQATIVFIGSENAGRIVSAVTSVGSSVAADRGYDGHIVRRGDPPRERDHRDAAEQEP